MSEKVDWDSYRKKIDENMDLFAKEMMSEPERGWTARSRY